MPDDHPPPPPFAAPAGIPGDMFKNMVKAEALTRMAARSKISVQMMAKHLMMAELDKSADVDKVSSDIDEVLMMVGDDVTKLTKMIDDLKANGTGFALVIRDASFVSSLESMD